MPTGPPAPPSAATGSPRTATRGTGASLVVGCVVGCALPAVWLLQRTATGDLGANPIEEALNQSGLAALILLIASLACTPLKLTAGWSWPIRLRKTLGLAAFFYASLHFFIYLGLDAQFDLALILDVTQRPFTIAGFLAWLALAPLALTSSRYWLRRLGYVKWKRLHRLAYLAGALGCTHFIWREKSAQESIVYAVVLGLLLSARFLGRKQRRATSSAPSS